tara:strand:+ start:298 stop:516 length:219 start_codon:yes stop_codon:yes gene_type:complete
MPKYEAISFAKAGLDDPLKSLKRLVSSDIFSCSVLAAAIKLVTISRKQILLYTDRNPAPVIFQLFFENFFEE